MKNPVCLLGLTLVVFGIASQSLADDLGPAVQSQAQRSLVLMMQNISRPGTAKGSVAAAPSTVNPNYYFHWIRDAALTMEAMVDIYSSSAGAEKAAVRQDLLDYVTFSRQNQLTPNRSGGLGEPKFNMDGSAFTGDWGRPQNDGPASRAVTLMNFAKILMREGQGNYVRQYLYDGKIPTNTVIKADLEYVSHNWQNMSFDLWEEISGHHFYTTIVSRAAMVEGAQFAQAMGDTGAATFYRQQAAAITQMMSRFWDGNRGILVETVDQAGGISKSGLDVAVILGAIHGDAGDGFLSPSSDAVMGTAYQLMLAFQKIYPINQNSQTAPAIGRYPEDVYNGTGVSIGNPWFLATLAYAELCNRIRVEFSHAGNIKVSALNKPFLDLALHGSGTVTPGTTISSGSPQFAAIISGFGAMGDMFFKTVFAHRNGDGSLSEQFSRQSGFEMGAPNLSWSHAAFITASLWRSAR